MIIALGECFLKSAASQKNRTTNKIHTTKVVVTSIFCPDGILVLKRPTPTISDASIKRMPIIRKSLLEIFQ